MYGFYTTVRFTHYEKENTYSLVKVSSGYATVHIIYIHPTSHNVYGFYTIVGSTHYEEENAYIICICMR